jgi:hypothetical protein
VVRLLCVGLGVVLLATGAPAQPAGAVDIDDVHAFFDHSMPSRMVQDSDGAYPDAVSHVECSDPDDPNSCTNTTPTLDVQPPGGWRVDLDACASTPGPDEINYQWHFLGTGDPVPVQPTASPCKFSVMFPQEGTFDIQLSLIDGFSVSYQRRVVVQDFLIVALGDSAGAGEGSPNIAATDDSEAVWQDRSCHRSSRNGTARAATMLEQLDPHTSVTYINLACSGAKVMDGLIEPYDGVDRLALDKYPEVELRKKGLIPKIPPQLQAAAQLVGDREIDALDISIGVNDANFSEVVESCAMSEPCQTSTPEDALFGVATILCGVFDVFTAFACDVVATILIVAIEAAVGPNFTTMTAQEIFDKALNGDGTPTDTCVFCGLDEGYRQLADALLRSPTDAPDAGRDTVGLGLPATDTDRVYLSQYMDPTTKPQVDTHDPDSDICGGFEDFFTMFPGVTRTEAKWMRNSVVPPLNDAVADGASTHGWTVVGGISDSWYTHGYCADDHWTVRLDESFRDQHDAQGVIHPNRRGYDVFRNEILERWLPDLYPDSDGFGPGIHGTDSTSEVLEKAENHLEFHPDPRLPAVPLVDAGGPYVVDEGSLAAVSATATDPSDANLDEQWSIQDSTPDGIASLLSAAGDTALLRGRDDGFGHLSFTATNDAGRSSTTTAFFQVQNVPPTVDAGADTSIAEGSTLTRTVSLSDPGTLDTHNATVDWGDGTTSPLAPVAVPSFGVSHVYADDGAYAVAVCAYDDDLGSDCDSFDVDVTNAAPTVSVGTRTAGEGATVALPTTTFNDGGTLDTHTATVSWGDGTAAEAAVVNETPSGPPGSAAGLSGSVTTSGGHVYADNGSYTVTVCVSDDDGGSTCAAGTANIGNVAPTVSITSLGDGLGFFLPLVSIPLSATFRDAGTLDTHAATAAWGDGTSSGLTVGETPFGPPGSSVGLDGTLSGAHAYAAAGTFTVGVTVTDDDGGSKTVTRQVAVVTPAEAAQRTAAVLRALATNPAVKPAARSWLADAVAKLDGNGPLAANSAATKFRTGDVVAGIVKLQAAIVSLDAAIVADPSITADVRLAELVITQTGESAAAAALAAAAAVVPPADATRQAALARLRRILAEGSAFRVAGNYPAALADFKTVAQGAVTLLG